MRLLIVEISVISLKPNAPNTMQNSRRHDILNKFISPRSSTQKQLLARGKIQYMISTFAESIPNLSGDRTMKQYMIRCLSLPAAKTTYGDNLTPSFSENISIPDNFMPVNMLASCRKKGVSQFVGKVTISGSIPVQVVSSRFNGQSDKVNSIK